MLHIRKTIVVEGKYDKEQLKKITDAPIICTGGFNIYKDKQMIAYLKQAAKKDGIIILTDSDAAGFKIRNYLKQCIGEFGNITNVYIPSLKGKEKRKESFSKEGLLGVEGIDLEVLKDLLKKADLSCEKPPLPFLDKARFFSDGFSGKPDSLERRKALSKILNLPIRISANSMIDIINKTFSEDEYKNAVLKIEKRKAEWKWIIT